MSILPGNLSVEEIEKRIGRALPGGIWETTRGSRNRNKNMRRVEKQIARIQRTAPNRDKSGAGA